MVPSFRAVGVEAAPAGRPARDRGPHRPDRRAEPSTPRESSLLSRRPATARRHCWRSGPRCRQPRVAWVSADDRDNDPAVLLTYLAVALDRIERINPAVFRALASPARRMTVVPLLVSAIASMRRAGGPGPRPRRGDHEPGVPRHDRRARAVHARRVAVCHRLPGRPAAADGPPPRAGRHRGDRRRRSRHGRPGGGFAAQRRRGRPRRAETSTTSSSGPRDGRPVCTWPRWR